MDLAMWLQQRACYYRRTSSVSKHDNQQENNAPRMLVLLRLDHMRNRTRYVKVLCSWARELDVKVSLLFARHLILVLLEGSQAGVKEYMRRHKSCNVDVDSNGKPCKEHMMTVLTQEEQDTGSQFPDFEVVECSSYSDLEEQFKKMNLYSLYESTVKPLLFS